MHARTHLLTWGREERFWKEEVKQSHSRRHADLMYILHACASNQWHSLMHILYVCAWNDTWQDMCRIVMILFVWGDNKQAPQFFKTQHNEFPNSFGNSKTTQLSLNENYRWVNKDRFRIIYQARSQWCNVLKTSSQLPQLFDRYHLRCNYGHNLLH